jgi:hypothetical protein
MVAAVMGVRLMPDLDEPTQAAQISWLSATRQRPKLLVANVLGLVGCIAWAVSWFHTSLALPGASAQILEYTGEGLGITSLLVLVFLIQCPECKARPVSALTNRSTAGRWFLDLQTTTTCPACGHLPPSG